MIVVYRSGKPWATPIEDAFISGLKKHDERFVQRPEGERCISDVAVIWSHRDQALFDTVRKAGGHYLVMERGYVGDIHNRRKWTSLGWDGLNGRAKFPKADDKGSRWERFFGGYLKPWRIGGQTALVCGQVPGDASLKGFDIEAWGQKRCEQLRDCGYKAHYRPHPNYREPDKTLEEDLGGAQFVVTYNSNTGVDAVLAGIPAIAEDRGSMVWPVTGHDIHSVCHKDRTAWAHDLAWAQWQIEEIQSGVAWDRLKNLIN